MVEPLRSQFERRFHDREQRSGRRRAGGKDVAVVAAQNLKRREKREGSHRDAQLAAPRTATAAAKTLDDRVREEVDDAATNALLLQRLRARCRRLLLGLHPGDKA